MSGKIFYRKRTRSKEEQRHPRFRIVAVSGLNLKIYTDHLRKKELNKVAEECGATLVELKRDPDKKDK